jgi:hypothetical protein
MPYFEAALTAENSMGESSNPSSGVRLAQSHGPGLPSNPRDLTAPHIRKAPSLSTFAVPMLSPRTASDSLINALATLISRLPRENRDLLRTVTELISATARASAETKMPLSNLLLVFCPSMMMSPPLLRVLCEGKGIWDGPPEGAVLNIPDIGDKDEDGAEKENVGGGGGSPMDEGSQSSESGIDANGSRSESKNGTSDVALGGEISNKDGLDGRSASSSSSRGAVPTLSSLTLPLISTPSTGKNETDSVTSSGTPNNLYSPPGLSASSDSWSLRTPSNSGCNPAAALFTSPSNSLRPSTADSNRAKPKLTPLRSQSDLPSPSTSFPSTSVANARSAIRRSLIGHPIPFPMAMGGGGSSAPVTPIEHAMDILRGATSSNMKSRSSVYSSSSPNLQEMGFNFPSTAAAATTTTGRSSNGNSNTSSAEASSNSLPMGTNGSGLRRRKSKASLLGLKAKRSISSLFGLAQVQTQTQTQNHSQKQSLERPDAEVDAEFKQYRHDAGAKSSVPDLTLEDLGEFPEPPRSSTPCPVLMLPVDTSRMDLGLGLSVTDEPSQMQQQTPNLSSCPITINGGTLRLPTRRPSEDVLDRVSSDDSAVTNSVFYTPPTTSRGLMPESYQLSTASSNSSSGSGSRSFLDFNIGQGPEEDWAKSVLMAATSSSGGGA